MAVERKVSSYAGRRLGGLLDNRRRDGMESDDQDSYESENEDQPNDFRELLGDNQITRFEIKNSIFGNGERSDFLDSYKEAGLETGNEIGQNDPTDFETILANIQATTLKRDTNFLMNANNDDRKAILGTSQKGETQNKTEIANYDAEEYKFLLENIQEACSKSLNKISEKKPCIEKARGRVALMIYEPTFYGELSIRKTEAWRPVDKKAAGHVKVFSEKKETQNDPNFHFFQNMNSRFSILVQPKYVCFHRFIISFVHFIYFF